MCLENVLISLASDVCKCCRWKFTVVHSTGLLIKVIHQSAPSKSINFLDPVELYAYSLDQNCYINTWRNSLLVSWQNWCEAINATEGNEEQVMWEDSIIYEILGLEISGVPKNRPDTFSIAFKWWGKTMEKTQRLWVNSSYLTPLK